MMQAIAQETNTTEGQAIKFSLSFSFLAVMAVVIFSAVFHFAGLDEIPLSQSEARQALSAWRSVMPNVAGEPIVAESPLVFWSQKIAFTLLGGSEFSARAISAFASVLLSLSPFLFTALLGKSRVLVMVVLLSVSPILLATGRMSSGTTWAMLMGVLGLWCAWRYWATTQKRYAVAMMVAGSFLMFMSESQGIILMLVLVGAGIVAYLLTWYASFMNDSPSELTSVTRERLLQFPILSGMGVSALLVFVIATGGMFAPSAISVMGELLAQFFRGWTISQRHPMAYNPFDTLLFYEIWLIPFFFIAINLLVSQHKLTFVERFLIVWVIFAFIAILIYPDTTTTHALWFVLPMVALMAYVISQAFLHSIPNDVYPVLVTDERGLIWGKFVVALAMFVLLILLFSHLQFVSRGILLLQNGTPSNFFASIGSLELAQQVQRNRYVGVPEAMIVSVIVLVMMLIGYFLATTIWGTVTPLQGAVIGIGAFVWMASFGTAWSVSYHRADMPVELFHYPQTTSKHTYLLRQTMQELAFRQTQGMPALPVAVLAPQDGAVAWILRDFHRVRYVSTIQEAQTYEAIIIPINSNSPRIDADLGGSYVGQPFTITSQWLGAHGFTSYWQPLRRIPDILRFPQRAFAHEINLDLMTWWLLRETRQSPHAVDSVLLWVRQDVYDNVPLPPLTQQ